jgi:hypothetical protein
LTLAVEEPGKQLQEIVLPIEKSFGPELRLDLLGDVLDVLRAAGKQQGVPDYLDQFQKSILTSLLGLAAKSIVARPRAIAPIRSKPERVYSKMEDSPVPSGQHMPMLLRRAFGQANSGSQELRMALNEFGRASGLFDELGVKRFGHTESDPFQITVTSQGPAFNLVDVGYGISQVLPVLVDSLEAPEQGTILLQQPEVHLHPRAQAELGTFLGKLVKQQRKTFVVETHSDYIIDRVRMDIRDKKTLAPDDVSILFFEKTGGAVNIHRIDIDEIGNIKNAPDAYRKFFMEEEKRYFGGT